MTQLRRGSPRQALDVLADVEGHLLADVRAMIHWATRAPEPPAGMGRLNFALMATALIGCESLGYLIAKSEAPSQERGGRDVGTQIVTFIRETFPQNNRFKGIAKVLADGMRHELIHGFGSRRSSAPFELGLYVSDDPAATWEIRSGQDRPILAINAVAFAKAVLSACESLKHRVAKNSDLAARVVANARAPFPTQPGVISEWNNQVAKRRPRVPYDHGLQPATDLALMRPPRLKPRRYADQGGDGKMTILDPKPSDDLKPSSQSSVFEPDSAVCAAALNDLAVVIEQAGFIVDKKRVSENTLRVYVRKRLTYPLLNPRFQRRSILGLGGRGILEITALSKGDEVLGRRLAAFPSSAAALFKSVGSQDGRYFNHGYFAVPLSFRGAGTRRCLDVAALGPALTSIRRYLE